MAVIIRGKSKGLTVKIVGTHQDRIQVRSYAGLQFELQPLDIAFSDKEFNEKLGKPFMLEDEWERWDIWQDPALLNPLVKDPPCNRFKEVSRWD